VDHDAGLDVRFEDDHLLIVVKPAGQVVHPAYKNPDGTLLDALIARNLGGGDHRPSIVGRLDKQTSGVVIVAKRPEVHAGLQRAMSSRDSRKMYLAIVYGVPERCGEIDLPVGHDPADRRRMIVSGQRSASSLTEFERVASVSAPDDAISLVRCRLITGRRHQIRVHLAARGWPIVGDPVYGQPRWSSIRDGQLAATLRDFPRQALHAERVSFTHPIVRTRLQVDAPPPPDFCRLLAAVFPDSDRLITCPDPLDANAQGSTESPV
jgi:23S rRNA pseudouridine1911/1915/1917 synthase